MVLSALVPVGAALISVKIGREVARGDVWGHRPARLHHYRIPTVYHTAGCPPRKRAERLGLAGDFGGTKFQKICQKMVADSRSQMGEGSFPAGPLPMQLLPAWPLGCDPDVNRLARRLQQSDIGQSNPDLTGLSLLVDTATKQGNCNQLTAPGGFRRPRPNPRHGSLGGDFRGYVTFPRLTPGNTPFSPSEGQPASLASTFLTLEGCHIPPLAVLIPRRFNSSAIVASVVCPQACTSCSTSERSRARVSAA